MSRTNLMLASVFVPLGCAGNVTHLTQQGQAVEVVMDGDAVKGCEFIAPVVAREGANFRGYESNIDRATNAVRNKAAQRRATHLLLQPSQATD